MTNIAEELRAAAESLGKVSENPRLDAEILLAMATGKTRSHFLAWPDKQLADGERQRFQALLSRRMQGHPIAHITGIREFWSREFIVTPDVLIPRPATESLVELALALISMEKPAQIADLGAGSGAIAVTLALELPRSRVTALDLCPKALEVASRNAKRLGAHNILFLQSDWFAALPDEATFDLVVSNPPYVAENDPHLFQGDVRFEPRAALVSGSDGLADISRIVRESPSRLNPGGWLLFEHGYDQAEAARKLLSAHGFVDVRSYRDLQGHERVSGGRHAGIFPSQRGGGKG